MAAACEAAPAPLPGSRVKLCLAFVATLAYACLFERIGFFLATLVFMLGWQMVVERQALAEIDHHHRTLHGGHVHPFQIPAACRTAVQSVALLKGGDPGMTIFDGIISGFFIALTPMNLMFGFLGALVGTAVGVLPGLGPAATIALLLPITYSIPSPVPAVILMAGIYYGAMYGGSTTSILLNLPGEAASVVTCIDGYKMAQKGQAGPALGIAAIGSFIAGTVSVVGLTLFAPPIAEFALSFGPPEKFSLALLGLLMAVTLSGASVTKGLIIMVLGLLFGTVGIDPISGKSRFDFGVTELQSGFDFVTLAVGVFGLGEIFYNLEQAGSAEIVTTKVGQVFPRMADWVQIAHGDPAGHADRFLRRHHPRRAVRSYHRSCRMPWKRKSPSTRRSSDRVPLKGSPAPSPPTTPHRAPPSSPCSPWESRETRPSP